MPELYPYLGLLRSVSADVAMIEFVLAHKIPPFRAARHTGTFHYVRH